MERRSQITKNVQTCCEKNIVTFHLACTWPFFTSLEEMVSYFYDEISRMVNDSTRFMNLTEALYAYSHV